LKFKIWNLKFECTNGDMRAQIEICAQMEFEI